MLTRNGFTLNSKTSYECDKRGQWLRNPRAILDSSALVFKHSFLLMGGGGGAGGVGPGGGALYLYLPVGQRRKGENTGKSHSSKLKVYN